MRRAALVAAVVLLGVASPAAPAQPYVSLSEDLLQVSGLKGADTIVVTVSGDGRTARVDAGTTHEGSGCRPEHGAIVCTRASPLRRIEVRGGAGDDRLDVRGFVPTMLDGGPGEDVVLGGSGPDQIVAIGWQRGAELERDVFDGRLGVDTVDFAAAGEALRVDLDEGFARAGDVAAVVRSVERALGGSGDDVLVGDEHPNVLGGGAGDDRLVGEEGDDVLLGSVGDDVLAGGFDRDTLRAGLGDDVLHATAGDRATPGDGADRVTARGPVRLRVDGDRLRDRVRCHGSTHGALIVADVGDAVDAACGSVRRRRVRGLVAGAPEDLAFPLRLAPEQLRIWCGAAAADECRGTFVLRAGKRRAGRGTFGPGRMRVKLSGWARRRLDAGRRVPVIAIATRRPSGLPARNPLVLLPSTEGSDV